MNAPLPAHSKLGASSMHRWSACPGSVRMCEGRTSEPTIHSATGTLAHELGAECLNKDLNMSAFFTARYEREGFTITVDEKMARAVQTYVDTIRGDALEDEHNPPIRFVEQGFHMAELHPDLHGTADCVQIWPAKKLLRTYDYKNGTSYVSAEKNKQLNYYALGAMLKYKKPISEIETVIVQPNCAAGRPVRRHRFKAVEMLDFENELMGAARATEDPIAPLVVGSHCYWCAAKDDCPARAAERQATARTEFATGEDFKCM